MSFLTPTFLVGLAGMLLPVLIHLLTRDRVRRVEFSTLRFFVKTSGRVLRRKRFREMVLLLLRAVVCGLLAVAFARPLLEDDRADEEALAVVRARTARVILVDVSASMRRPEAAEAMKNAARRALADLAEGADAVAVVTFAADAVIEAPLATKFDNAAEAVDSLGPGHGATNIPRGLRRANDQLKRARAESRQIVLISDLQRTGWQHLTEGFKLSPGVELVVRPIAAEAGAAGAAIRKVDFPQTTTLDRESQDIRVQIANYSPRPLKGLVVRLTLGGETQERKVNIRASGTAAATFRHVFETPGDNPGRIEVPPADVFHFNTRVIPKVQVVLIDGGMQQGRPSEAAFYLETAMTPGLDVSSPFACKTLGASQVTPADLKDAQVVLLADVHSVSAAASRALAELVRQGGGLLLLPGGRVEPKAFAASFGDLAPCKLRKVRTGRMLRAGGTGAALASIDFEHPIFRIFSHPRHGDLSLPKFRRYWEVTDSQLSQVLAKFDDNRPAVLCRRIGNGVSMMLAASPEAKWTDFPRHTTFLPYVWQTLKYLAARTEQRTAYLVGEALPVPEGHELTGPDGKVTGALQAAASKPGLYVLKDAQGRPVRTVAVNRDPAESDPAVVAADEIVAAVQQVALRAPAAAAGGSEGDGEDEPRTDERGLWWWLVLAMTALLAGELLLGNKTLRH